MTIKTLDISRQKDILDTLTADGFEPTAISGAMKIAEETERKKFPHANVERLIGLLKNSPLTEHTAPLMLALAETACKIPPLRAFPVSAAEIEGEMQITRCSAEEAPARIIKMKIRMSERMPDVYPPLAELQKEEFSSWSHSLCHVIEAYEPSASPAGLHKTEALVTSLLDVPELHGGAAVILDETVRRALEIKSIGCLDRMLGGVVAYNLAATAHKGIEDTFAFKTDLLGSSPDLVDLLQKPSDALNRAFLNAQTPSGLLQTIVKENITLAPKLYVALRPRFAELFDDEVMNNYLEQSDTLNKGSSSDIGALARIYNSGFSEGFHFDVDDTLINDGKLNPQVAALALSLRHAGASVTIFTGASPTEKSGELQALGFPLTAVQPKENYKSKVLGVLIDDTEAFVQGFATLKHIKPEHLKFHIHAGDADIVFEGTVIKRDLYDGYLKAMSTPVQPPPALDAPKP